MKKALFFKEGGGCSKAVQGAGILTFHIGPGLAFFTSFTSSILIVDCCLARLLPFRSFHLNCPSLCYSLALFGLDRSCIVNCKAALAHAVSSINVPLWMTAVPAFFCCVRLIDQCKLDVALSAKNFLNLFSPHRVIFSSSISPARCWGPVSFS